VQNEYPLKRHPKGMDKGHHRVYDPYDELIVEVLRRKPWSNISEIVRELENIGKEDRVKLGLPKGKPQRDTVRKHLRRMEAKGKVWKIRHGHILMEDVVGKSYELHRRVSGVLSGVLRQGELEDVNYALAQNTAGCYLATQPAGPIDFAFAGSFHLQEALRFAKGLFWLEDMVALAIRRGHLSRRVLRKEINFARLNEGLKRSFGNTELIVLAFAVNLSGLLSFLATASGQAQATRILEQKRDAILQKARSGTYSKEDMGLIHSYSWQP
jgi:hypothetical protein